MNDQSTQLVDNKNKIAKWRTEITEAWNKSIESIVNVATLLKEANEDIASQADYEELISNLPFSASVASNLRKIGNNSVLTDEANFGKLPSYINTLYYLAFIPEDELKALIEKTKIDPYTKLAEAKRLAIDHGWKADASKLQGPRFEDMVEVGQIAVPKSTNIAQFISALDNFLAKYQAASRYTHKEGSLAEKYREIMLEKAEAKIEETKKELGDYNIEQVRMLDKAANYLSVRSNKRAVVTLKNNATKESGLPTTNENYDDLKNLLGADVTNANIKEWCNKNKVPCQLMVRTLDKEVYVWELLRIYATDSKNPPKDGAKAHRLLEKIIKEKGTTEGVKNAATDALAIAKKFENPRKPRNESRPRKKKVSGKKTG